MTAGKIYRVKIWHHNAPETEERMKVLSIKGETCMVKWLDAGNQILRLRDFQEFRGITKYTIIKEI